MVGLRSLRALKEASPSKSSLDTCWSSPLLGVLNLGFQSLLSSGGLLHLLRMRQQRAVGQFLAESFACAR